MAFETNTLVNGEWTTRTLDLNTVLKHFDQESKETNIRDLDIERAPTLGLLTQTVVRSPLVHWILPARLRNPERNDVAFIGVRVLLCYSFSLLMVIIITVYIPRAMSLSQCKQCYVLPLVDRVKPRRHKYTSSSAVISLIADEELKLMFIG